MFRVASRFPEAEREPTLGLQQSIRKCVRIRINQFPPVTSSSVTCDAVCFRTLTQHEGPDHFFAEGFP